MNCALLLAVATLILAASACTGGQLGATSNIAATVEGRTQTTQETDPPVSTTVEARVAETLTVPTADPAHTPISQGSHAVATTPTTTYEEQLADELFGCLTENPEYVEREFGEEISSLLEDPDSFRSTILRALRSNEVSPSGFEEVLVDCKTSSGLYPTATSPSIFGRHHQGRTLNISVVSIERAPELLYTTTDHLGVIRDWRLAPSAEGLELALVRLEVQNHTAVSAVVNIERSLVLLRDSTGESYFPFDIAASVRQDLRGSPSARIRIDEGQCFDPNRVVVDVGAELQWVNERQTAVVLQFDPEAGVPGETGLVKVPVGATFSHIMNEGIHPYECGTGESFRLAEVLVEEAGAGACVSPRSVVFLQGSFDLPKGHGIDGWMVFEMPPGTQIRDLRWRAGDSITIRLSARSAER